MNATACASSFAELSALTLTLGDPEFVHQTVVDTYAAQHPSGLRPMRVWFALVGLHLVVEHGRDGRHVQRCHTSMAERRVTWPALPPPDSVTPSRAADILGPPDWPARKTGIQQWAASVWESWEHVHPAVAEANRGASPNRS